LRKLDINIIPIIPLSMHPPPRTTTTTMLSSCEENGSPEP